MDGQVNHVDGVANLHDAIPEDGHGPIPPRFWWLKRVSIGLGVLLVGLVVLRIWWGWEADRRLQAEIDRIIASGEPFYPEDYIRDIPDEQNAAVLYEEAAGAIRGDPNSKIDVVSVCNDLEECEKHLDEVRALIELNAPVIDLVRRARTLPEVSWKNPGVTQAQLSAALGLFSADRQVAKTLRLAAYVHFQDGNHEEFVETLLDMIAHGEAQAQRPIVIGSLVAWACEGLAVRMIGECAGELVVGQETASKEIRPVRRSTVESLISVLLDERSIVGGYNAARNGERTFNYDYYSALLNSAGSKSSLAELIFSLPSRVYEKPLVKLDLARSLRSETDLVLPAEESWQAIRARFESVRASVGLVRSLARPISESRFDQSSYPTYGTICLLYKLSTLRRLNATGLAVRLFELDYGRRPETLELLVPDYLPSVPTDPFSGDGAEIRYVRESGHDRLYSVGINGFDDGGENMASIDLFSDGQPDFVLFLDVKSDSAQIAQESAPASLGQTIENGQQGKN